MNRLSVDALLEQAERRFREEPPAALPVQVAGRIQEALGIVLRASGIHPRIGELCRVDDVRTGRSLLTEVIGFSRGEALLTPLGPMHGLSSRARVIATGETHRIGVGPALIGRVLDGFGRPIDGKGPIVAETWVDVDAAPPNPMQRAPIRRALHTGVRCIDALTTVGQGQRIGIFAPAGVGKSTLLSMMARGAAADVIVLGLVGERGREVREFIEHQLGPDALRRCVVVVATSDTPAMERIKCAGIATAIAEHFRDRGRQVLLLMDSITRFARAQREIGLASGEPPTRRGFPPSLFAALPRLLERTGPGAAGSITAFYTVLTEGEDIADPVAEEVRSILDGHIVLSQRIAARAQFPAIDVLASLSRLAHAVSTEPERRTAAKTRAILAKYEEIETLLQIGEFERGHDRDADEAIDRIAAVRAFLRQGVDEAEPPAAAMQRLAKAVGA
ncbi:MAG: FliI/YscN family ATPase [Burkholderiaceae bacterium]